MEAGSFVPKMPSEAEGRGRNRGRKRREPPEIVIDPLDQIPLCISSLADTAEVVSRLEVPLWGRAGEVCISASQVALLWNLSAGVSPFPDGKSIPKIAVIRNLELIHFLNDSHPATQSVVGEFRSLGTIVNGGESIVRVPFIVQGRQSSSSETEFVECIINTIGGCAIERFGEPIASGIVFPEVRLEEGRSLTLFGGSELI